MSPSKKNSKYIEGAKAHSILKSIPSYVTRIASLVDDATVGHHTTNNGTTKRPLSKKSAKAIQKEVHRLESQIKTGVGRVLHNWTAISGNGSNSYSHNRDMTETKRSLAASSKSHSTLGGENTDNCKDDIGIRTGLATPPRMTMRKRRVPQTPHHHRSTSKPPSPLSTPPRPPPSNGVQYAPSEAAKHINDHPIKLQGKICKSMHKLQQIPVTPNGMARIARRVRLKGLSAPLGWKEQGFTGRPAIASSTEILEKLKSTPSSHYAGKARTSQKETVQKALNDLRKDKDGEFAHEVSRRTVYNTYSWLKGKIPGSSKTRHKTENRIIAENSIRSILAFLHVVSSSHYTINTAKNAQDPPSLHNASNGAKELYKMISKHYNDAPLLCVHNDLTCSTDDSGIFASTTNQSSKREEWNLILNNDVDTATQALYATSTTAGDNRSFRSGATIRMTHTMTSSGKLAPIFCQVLHLTVRELPIHKCPDGICIVPIPGLCVGAAVDNRCKNNGYVVFARQGVDESAIFKKYIHTVFLPFVKKIREELGFVSDVESNMEIPDELFAISWSDGGQAQLRNTISDEIVALFDKLKIVSNKHNASRSGREQPCDLASFFRALRDYINALLLSDYVDGSSLDAYRRVIHQCFNNAYATFGLNLNSKRDIIMRFLICLPNAVSQAAKPESIRKGFMRSGMIDSAKYEYPCLMGIIRTLGRAVTYDDIELVRETFDHCLAEQIKHGELTPAFMDNLVMTVAQDPNEDLRRSEALSYQRAKTVNHSHQKMIRARKLQLIEDRKQDEITEQQDRNHLQLDKSQECERRLLAHSNVSHADNHNQNNSSQCMTPDGHIMPGILNTFHQHMFEKCTVVELKGFILVRMMENIPKRFKKNPLPSVKTDFAKLACNIRGDVVKVKRNAIQGRSIESIESTHEPSMLGGNDDTNVSTSPSSFLKKIEWRKDLCSVIRGVIRKEYGISVADHICKGADQILPIIMERFTNHFNLRSIEDRRDHYAFKWARNNIPRIVAANIFFGHIRNDAYQFHTNMNTCLLSQPDNLISGGAFISARLEETKVLEGNYLYFDERDKRWRRSGMTSGESSNHGKRDATHQANSKDPGKSGIIFYRHYPFSSDVRVEPGLRKGYFPYLQQFCGLSYERGNTRELTNTEGANTFLDWDEYTMSMLRNEAERREDVVENIQLKMVAYLFELVTSLCIGEESNVSESGGFETIARTYKK